MNVVLLRVGIDTGCGGLHSPLFEDGTFEFVPIPDSKGQDERTYGNASGRKNRTFAEYFPKSRRSRIESQSMHVDPEFESFTYGDPTPPKRNLAKLEPGDLLVFYAGMKGWDYNCPPALYLAGFFRVKLAGFAPAFSSAQLDREFRHNYHVRHPTVFNVQREKLVLVKGDKTSRLFHRAHLIGETVRREDGSVWQIITPKMEKVFGRFGGIGSLQRSTPRWVEEKLVSKAERFVESLH
jgi:hypothetical protein